MRVPHDDLFRRTFAYPERARELLRVALPDRLCRGLNLDSIEVRPGSFVDRGLRPLQTDLLIETSSRGQKPVAVYVLVEHKSATDKRAPLQLLRYMAAIWDAWSSREANRAWRQLPPIIPVILSNAPRRWRGPLSFAELVSEPLGLSLRPYAPSFSVVILDLSRRAGSDLGRDQLVNAVLRLLKHARAGPAAAVAGAIEAIVDLATTDREGGLLEAALTYVFRTRQSGSAEAIMHALSVDTVRRRAMTIAERLERKGRLEGRREGKQEGKQEGRQEGRLQMKREVLARLVEQKFGLDASERLLIDTHRSAAALDAAIDAFVTARTKTAVLRHLR